MSRVDGFKLFALALIFCLIYAINDEIYQHFVPVRGPQVCDVIIDSAGSTIEIAINFIVAEIFAGYNKSYVIFTMIDRFIKEVTK